MFVLRWDDLAWNLPAGEITERFGSSKWGAEIERGQRELDAGPITYVFRTQDGSLGMLRFDGFTDNPPGVKICYKLIERSPK